MSSRWRWCAALAATLAAVLPREATAQSCNTESYRNTANAAFAQLGELGGREEWVTYWTSALQTGYSVKYMMQANLHDAVYFDRFVTGRAPEAIVADLYRHILAREPDDGASAWIGVGQTQGWHVVIDALLNGAEYTTRFNDFVVPGSPVVAWDCARAGVYADTTGIMQAHSGTFRDAGQGGSSVSYTTPAYVSLDQPRALTFSYSSGTAKPTGLVQFNVVNQNVYNPLQKASIRLLINGVSVTGEQVYQAGLGTTLLSAEFNAAANPSAAYLVTAVIRLYH
ncbi:MAG TPA: phycobilisome rod-core linker polypeptide, partial [Longimicrobium sp.]